MQGNTAFQGGQGKNLGGSGEVTRFQDRRGTLQAIDTHSLPRLYSNLTVTQKQHGERFIHQEIAWPPRVEAEKGVLRCHAIACPGIDITTHRD